MQQPSEALVDHLERWHPTRTMRTLLPDRSPRFIFGGRRRFRLNGTAADAIHQGVELVLSEYVLDRHDAGLLAKATDGGMKACAMTPSRMIEFVTRAGMRPGESHAPRGRRRMP